MTERKLARTRALHVAPRAVLAAFLRTGYGVPAMAQTQPEMNENAARSFDKADAKLNDADRGLMATLDAAAREKLRRPGRAWLAWRDAECALATDSHQGGSADPMVELGCWEELTRVQEERLARRPRCPEGPMACGG